MTPRLRQHRPGGRRDVSLVAVLRRLAGAGVVLLTLASSILPGLADSFADVLSVPTAQAAAGIYKPISYQGKLTLTSGTAPANGQYNLRFKVFTGATLGSPVWTETWNGSNKVSMTGGLFSVQLGSLTAMTGSVNFNTDNLYLQVEFDPANAGTYGEVFSPRRRFSAVPYALNSSLLNGLASTQFVRTDTGSSITAGALHILSAGTSLTVSGTASGNALHAERLLTTSGALVVAGNATFDRGTLFVDATNKRVGVGTAAPTQLLDLKGAAGVNIAILFEGVNGSGNSSTAGPTFAGVGTDDASVGANAWSNPSNITASDTAAASASVNNSQTHYLKASNFGFAIPSNATISGIVVEWEKKSSISAITDSAVRIVKGGVIGSTDKSSGTNWPFSFAFTTYGTSSDLWGQTWTPADINASTFGAAISATSSFNTTANIDSVRITVYYTTPGATARNWILGQDVADAGKFKLSQSAVLGTKDLLTVTGSGAVGIGTATPGSRLSVSGSVVIGSNIGSAAADANTALEIIGTASGRTIRATDTLTSSGVLIVNGNANFKSTLTIGGITYSFPSSDGSASGKVLKTDSAGHLSWSTDNNSGGGSFGTGNVITVGDQRYVNTSGDTMTGALVIVNGGHSAVTAQANVLLEITGTASGQSLHAESTLTSSGVLIVRKNAGTSTGNILVVDTKGLVYDATNKRVGIGTASPSSLLDVSGTETISGGNGNLLQMKIGSNTVSALQGLDLGSINSDALLSTNRYYDGSKWQYLTYFSRSGSSLLLENNNLNFYSFNANSTGAISRFIIDKKGYVGIGTPSPATLGDGGTPTILQVHNPGTALGSNGIINISTAGTATGTILGTIDFGTLGASIAGEHRGAEIISFITNNPAGNAVSGSLDFYTTNSGATVTDRVRIAGDGKVGIGTTSPTRLLDVNGPSTAYNGEIGLLALNLATDRNKKLYMGWDNSVDTNGAAYLQAVQTGTAYRSLLLNPTGGNIGIGTTSPAHQLQLSTDDAAKTTTTTWTVTSDARTKENIKAFTGGLAILKQLDPITFDYNGLGGTVKGASGISLIAQQVQPIAPYLIRSYKAKLHPDDTQFTDILSLNPHALFFLNINAFKEIDRRLSSLEGGAKLSAGDLSSSGALRVVGPARFGSGVMIAVHSTRGSDTALRVISDVGDSGTTVLRVNASGSVFTTGTFNSNGADYAEWFYASNPDLQAGEAVCIDVTRQNSVARCRRSGDPNVMGIVSTKPAFIGNKFTGVEGLKVPGTVLVGLIGQVPARAIVEDGSGAIRSGDPLTTAGKAGYVRRARAGESTVGVALEDLRSGEGRIQVLISRRNQSLTVDMVQDRVLQSIKDMKVEDQVDGLVASSIRTLTTSGSALDRSLASQFDARLNSLDLTAKIRAVLREMSGSLFPAPAPTQTTVGSPAGSSATFAVRGTLMVGGNSVLSGAVKTGTLTADALVSEKTLLVAGDTSIAGDLYLGGMLKVRSLFVPGIMKVDGALDVGSLTARTLHGGSGSSIDGTLAVHGDLLLSTGSILLGSGSSVRADRLFVKSALHVLGDVTVQGLATFLGDVRIAGQLTVSSRQAGRAEVARGNTGAVVRFDPPLSAAPVVTATPHGRVGGEWWTEAESQTGFLIRTDHPLEKPVTFSWIALVPDSSPFLGSASSASAVSFPPSASASALLPFPLDEHGVPLTGNAIEDACIRNQTPLDQDGHPYSCGRYHVDHVWQFGAMTFEWNTVVDPPKLTPPEGYTVRMHQAELSSTSSVAAPTGSTTSPLAATGSRRSGTGGSLSSSSPATSASDGIPGSTAVKARAATSVSSSVSGGQVAPVSSSASSDHSADSSSPALMTVPGDSSSGGSLTDEPAPPASAPGVAAPGPDEGSPASSPRSSPASASQP